LYLIGLAHRAQGFSCQTEGFSRQTGLVLWENRRDEGSTEGSPRFR
jgi:hypothetical protein